MKYYIKHATDIKLHRRTNQAHVNVLNAKDTVFSLHIFIFLSMNELIESNCVKYLEIYVK